MMGERRKFSLTALLCVPVLGVLIASKMMQPHLLAPLDFVVLTDALSVTPRTRSGGVRGSSSSVMTMMMTTTTTTTKNADATSHRESPIKTAISARNGRDDDDNNRREGGGGVVGRRRFVLSTTSAIAAAVATAPLFSSSSSSPSPFAVDVANAAVTTTTTTTTTGIGNAAPSAVAKDIASRFDRDILKQPAVSTASELGGRADNTYYPSYMEGTWDVTQTLVDVRAPLGTKFLGGPSGIETVGEKTMRESEERLNRPVRLRLRYVPTKWGVAEDRLYNARQRLDAFAGRSVVSSVNYADAGGSNRQSVLAMGGSEDDPLLTTFVRFKGPAIQKTFVTSHKSGAVDENSEVVWVGYEGQRSIFALTNESTRPPIFTDSEVLWRFRQVDDDVVYGKLRLVGYLNAQTDLLYFDARNRAVSILEYDLVMKRIAP